MSSVVDTSKRQVLPRWLSFSASSRLRLLSPARITRGIQGTELERSRPFVEWRELPNLTNAIDLVAEALALQQFQDPLARTAARLIVREIPAQRAYVRAIAEYFLSDASPLAPPANTMSPPATSRTEISLLRSALRRHPLDPVSWSDLSMYHAIAGNRDKSLEAMRIALGLAGDNRFILRSAARCLVHYGEPDRALHVLRHSGLCNIDPWITATEIAVAEQSSLRSRCKRRGTNQLDDDNFTHLARSELAAAMSTSRAGTRVNS